jgi:sugar phosphate isomerase/epimerase
VARIGQMGFRDVEISIPGLGGSRAWAQELNRLAAQWGLTYVVHAPNEGKPTELERLRGPFFEEILALMEACGQIGAPILTVHFWLDGRFIPAPVAKEKRRILWAMAREGARRGVRVCLENLSERPEDLAPALEGCAELGLTLDMGHAELLSPVNRSLEFIRRWPERICHVHAHDNRGGQSVRDDLHLPVGQGKVDFQVILRALAGARYRRIVTLEVPLDRLEASAKRLRRILQEARAGTGEER